MNNFFSVLALVGTLAYDEKGHSYLNENPQEDHIFQEWMKGETNDSESSEETC